MQIHRMPMYYRMPAGSLRSELAYDPRFAGGTSTLELIEAGLRTATTRRGSSARVGDVIYFTAQDRQLPTPFVVTQISRPDLRTPAGRDAWEQAEGWSLDWIDANPKLKEQVYSGLQTHYRPLPVLADVPPRVAAPRYYAGIGSRETPAEVRQVMQRLASRMEADGWILRSGGAPGADTAFVQGLSDRRNAQVFIPWDGFQDLRTTMPGVVDYQSAVGRGQAAALARQYHPRYANLSQGAQKLMDRNSMQVFGHDMATPSKLVVAWTPGGQVTGGTGQALRIAMDHDIEIRNLGIPEVMERALRYIG